MSGLSTRLWLLGLGFGCLFRANAAPVDNWTWRNPQPARFEMHAVTYGSGVYAAVGYEGAAATSIDGINWTIRSTGTQTELRGIAYGGGQFVAVGEFGEILASPNAINWVRRQSPTTSRLRDVYWHNSLFIVIGENRTLLTSSDGENWVPRGPGTASSLLGITYGGGKLVAVGRGGAFSTDGINWTGATGLDPNRTYTSVSYGNGRYVAGSSHGFYATSTNGSQWTTYTNRLDTDFASIAFGNGLFVAACSHSVFLPPQLYTSLDGISWKSRQVLHDGFLADILFGRDGFVAVGSSTVVTSPDGIDWTRRGGGRTAPLYAMATHDDVMVAVGENVILASSNGVDWIETQWTRPFVGRDVIWANGKFVAVGDAGILQCSTNGFDWERYDPSLTSLFEYLEGIAWGNGLFVTVGGSKMFVSTTGTNWTSLYPGFGPFLRAITFADGRFVAVGHQGKIRVSADGTNWTTQTIDSFSNYETVAYGNGVWVVGGGSASIRVSTNLVDWRLPSHSISPHGLAWAEGVFLAGDTRNIMASSTNGFDWELRTGSFIFLYDLAYHRGCFWGVGYGGMIQQSDPLTPSPPDILRQPASVVAPPGTTASLSVVATGSSPLRYQWQRDGTNIPAATNASLAIMDVQLSSTGRYAVVVSNALGTNNSEVASVTLDRFSNPPPFLGVRSTGTREFHLIGMPPQRYAIWQSSVLGGTNVWTPLKTVTLPRLPPFGPFTWIDETDAGSPQRFYRATILTD